jgi:hypothetical protein
MINRHLAGHPLTRKPLKSHLIKGDQGCQMVYLFEFFKTQKIWNILEVLGMENVIFYSNLVFLWPFGIFYGHKEYQIVIKDIKIIHSNDTRFGGLV